MQIERRNRCSNPDGPAVQLATATSIFPVQLAEVWRAKGMDVAIVSRDAQRHATLPNGTRMISIRQHYGWLFTRISKNYRLFAPLEKIIAKLFSWSYERKTGQRHLHPSEIRFVANVVEAFPTARVARSLKPRFVFGHDVALYGLATALCKGVPKVLFPWGGELFMGAETSPILFSIIKHSLHAADLIIPASETAARHICDRFGVSPDKVHALSWGVDNKLFKRATDEARRKTCEKYGIDPRKIIITNPRRFRPTWGCFVALEAFMRLASEDSMVHFIMLGGMGTEEYVREAKEKVAARGLSDRFTLLEGDVALDEFAEIMAASEIFVSLLGLGDMRSASVLQGIAAGAVPVISDNEEYRQIEKNGFAGIFVNPNDSEEVYSGVQLLLQAPEKRQDIRNKNIKYIEANENSETQMNKMLRLIDDVCGL